MLNNVRAALVAHYHGLGLSLPTVMENEDPKEGEHVKFDFVTTDNLPNTLGENGFDRYSGFMQFLIRTEAGKGPAQSGAIADQIVSHFKRGTRVNYSGTSTRITKPVREGGFNSDNKFTVPVTIYWSADIQR